MNKCIVSKNLVKWRFVDRRGRVSFNKIIHMFNSLYGFFKYCDSDLSQENIHSAFQRSSNLVTTSPRYQP